MERLTYLSLGTNLGDRLNYLERAMAFLSGVLGEAIQVSGVYETQPWGLKEQPAFLNMCAAFRTDMEPEQMIRELKAIEHKMGRQEAVKWGPRIIDIDILLIEGIQRNTKGLVLPHPRMWERAFVLIPLASIAPKLSAPNGNTIGELAREMDTKGEVRPYCHE